MAGKALPLALLLLELIGPAAASMHRVDVSEDAKNIQNMAQAKWTVDEGPYANNLGEACADDVDDCLFERHYVAKRYKDISGDIGSEAKDAADDECSSGCNDNDVITLVANGCTNSTMAQINAYAQQQDTDDFLKVSKVGEQLKFRSSFPFPATFTQKDTAGPNLGGSGNGRGPETGFTLDRLNEDGGDWNKCKARISSSGAKAQASAALALIVSSLALLL